MKLAYDTLARPRDANAIRADVANMRGLMERERAGRSVWDLKLAPGGFVDIEFIAQALLLIHAAAHRDVLAANTGEALDRLKAAGALSAEAHKEITEAWRLWSDLQQILRICVSGEFEAEVAPRLMSVVGVSDFEALEAMVRETQAGVRAKFVQIVGSPGDGSQPLSR
jgi:glutamate-ammonia-ligase adenylyltransferase